MATAMKTPGVYIVEKNAFPNSVVELETAVPAFIGYTQAADNNGKKLWNIPTRISSLAEFRSYFGGQPVPRFTLKDTTPDVPQLTVNQVQDIAKTAAAAAKKAADDAKSAADKAAKAGNDATNAPPDPAKAKALNDAANAAATDAAQAAVAAKTAADAAKIAADKAVASAIATADQKKAKDANSIVLRAAATAAQSAAQSAVYAAQNTATNPQASVTAAAALVSATNALAAATLAVTKTPPQPGAPAPSFKLTQDPGSRFLLYYSMVMFFSNGGGPCYVVAVGDYNSTPDPDTLKGGIDLLLREQEPTMVVIPDAILLQQQDCFSVQQKALQHCGLDTKSRVAILDVYNGSKKRTDPSGDCISVFRDQIGVNQLNYAAAYYPWLNTSVVTVGDVGCQNIANPKDLANFLMRPLDPSQKDTAAILAAINAIPAPVTATSGYTQDILNKTLMRNSKLFVQICTEMQEQLNLLPPSGAMAGVYSMVDGEKGVWKAPANVSLNSVVSPSVNISESEQEDLNVTPQGKSINAIRFFIGEGTLVWGARTLDGNNLDWRYISVRRTMIFLEQSIKLATKAYVFENNVANTWVTIKGMIRNFLTGIWKRGGLQGAVPDDAFQIFCGLGETMTADDILEGILRVSVLVAVTHPAEFIEITFEQQLAKS